MKQRLGIAAAIVEEWKLSFGRTDSLDTDGVELVKTILKAQRERGALVIFPAMMSFLLQMMSDEIYYWNQVAL